MLEYLQKPDLCVYVDTGARYAERELSRIVPPIHGPLIIEKSVDLAKWELPSTVVPQRNAFLALVAAYYGDRILLGATAGDVNVSDTLPGFADRMTVLLQYLWFEQYWTNHRNVRLEFPYVRMTKMDLVEEYIEADGPVDRILNGISCYSATSRGHCGVCIACARKWVALRWCGVECDSRFDEHPTKFFTRAIMAKLEKREWRCPREDEQTLEVLVSQ